MDSHQTQQSTNQQSNIQRAVEEEVPADIRPAQQQQNQQGPQSSSFHNLARGLPSSGNKPRSRSHSRNTQPQALDTQEPCQPTNQDGKLYRMTPDQLEAIQHVCAAENHSLQCELDQLQDTLNSNLSKQPNPDDQSIHLDQLRREQQATRDEQNNRIDAITAALASIGDIKDILSDVATLRRDTNTLLETQARQARGVDTNPPQRQEQGQPRQENIQPQPIGIPRNGREPPQQHQGVGYRDPYQARDQPRGHPQRARINYEDPYQLPSSDDEPEYHTGYPVGHQHERYREYDLGRTAKIPFYNRDKGPRYPGLTVNKPSDPLFDRLMNYRYYRLLETEHERDAQTLIDALKRQKALTIALGSDFKFDGSDPIMVFAFLTRLTEEADLNNLTEAQAFALLPRYLGGTAELQFQSVRSGSRGSGVRCWPEAVQYLLTTYATPSAIRQATQAVMDIKQNHGEDEEAYSARLCEALHRCGNAYDDSQKMTFFVNGLHRDTQSIVARHRESIPRHYMRYERLVSFARDEGQAQRSRLETARFSWKRANPTSALRNATVSFLEEPDTIPSVDVTNGQQLLMAGDGHPTAESILSTSIPTSDLPSTIDATQREEILAFGTAKPSRINYQDRNTSRNRPGWITSQKKLICYQCYAVDQHVSPDCQIQFSDLGTIVSNYEALSEQDRQGLPKMAYTMAKQLLAGAKPNGQPCGHDHDDDHSKNV